MNEDLLAIWEANDDTPIERDAIIRKPIPYPGSKERSIQQLLPHLPYTDRWVDVFGGSGCVTLSRRRSKFEVFNDQHSGITSFYRCLAQAHLKDKLAERLDLTVHSRDEFNWCRETWECDELDDVERAARWYYLCHYSFGTLCRNFGRSKGPKGIVSGKLKENIPHFHEIHERFARVQIECMDWRLILKDYDADDTVFYLDPPYYGINIYKHNLTNKDHIELCERIFNCRGFVALSGYKNPIYDNFPWDRVYNWPARVSITTKAITTDTSNVTEIGKNEEFEYLWIKEFS